MAVTLIADDLTGACDAGALFAGRGRVKVVLAGGAVDPAPEILAVDTETRALAPDEARRGVCAATRRLGTRLSGVLFKKIDSTMRGPVGGEVEALRQASGRPTVLLCPAFPGQGRTVVDGVLRVDGVPAHASAVGRDPGYPEGTSDVALILRRGGARPVRHLALEDVRAGRAHLLDRLARAAGDVVAADAETDADLDALAAVATSPDLVLAGSAGLARAVASRLGHAGSPAALPAGRAWLIVAGSLHPATRAQIRALEAAGVAGAIVDAAGEANLDGVAARLRRGAPAFLTTADVREPAAEYPAALATALARAARRLLARSRTDLVVVTGGETAYALATALAASHLDLVGAPSSGLALAELAVDGAPPLALLTKAGGFGAPDLFSRLLGGTN